MPKKPPAKRSVRSVEADREVRKVRNAHGTRVARSVVCTRCGRSDTLAFAPRDASRVLCRRCAAQELGVSDVDAGIRPEKAWTCTECGKAETAHWRGEDPFVCADCRHGIQTRQGNKSRDGERVGAGKIIRVRRG